ncbi:hypothetical protein ACFQ1S_12395, partial [Kibdelosporangium lantanae]
LVLAPAGLVTYLAFVAVRTGDVFGYFKLQERGWESHFDGGLATLRFVADSLTHQLSVLEAVTILVICSAFVLLVIGYRMRMQWPLLAYAIGVILLDVGSNGMMASKARLLLPAFVLLVPIAVALANRRTSTLVLSLCGLVVVTSWFGAYAVTVWSRRSRRWRGRTCCRAPSATAGSSRPYRPWPKPIRASCRGTYGRTRTGP